MKEIRGPWTVRKSRTVYKDAWISLRQDKVLTPTGKKSTCTILYVKDGAVVIPIDEHGNIYLIEEFRYTLNKSTVEIAGGGIDAGEDMLVAAKRELHEETGITANRWTHLGTPHVCHFISPAVCGIYMAEGLSFGENTPDQNESIVLKKMSLAEALNLVDTGGISDVLSIAGILLLSRELERRKKDTV